MVEQYKRVSNLLNEGSLLTDTLNCLNGCSFKWTSEQEFPNAKGDKGAGNIMLTSAWHNVYRVSANSFFVK